VGVGVHDGPQFLAGLRETLQQQKVFGTRKAETVRGIRRRIGHRDPHRRSAPVSDERTTSLVRRTKPAVLPDLLGNARSQHQAHDASASSG
jgi:hypothetical protein